MELSLKMSSVRNGKHTISMLRPTYKMLTNIRVTFYYMDEGMVKKKHNKNKMNIGR